MMRTTGLLAAALLALAALASCTLPFTSRSTVTPIYAATANGLSVFNGSTWTNYTTANGLASNTVRSVQVIGSGANAHIYAATGNGVSYYDGSSWSSLSTGLPGGTTTVNSIFLGYNYTYAGTSAGLYVFESGAWVAVANGSTAPGTSGTTINDVFSNGTAYVATPNGLYISDLSGANGFYQPANPPTGTASISAVFVDAYGDIFAGNSAGLQYYGAGSSGWSTSPISMPYLPSDTINSIFVDSYQDIFVATALGLAVSTDGGGTWTTYTTANGLGSDQVNQVFVVNNSIYAATAGGLSVSNDFGTTWKNYTTADGLGSNTVYGVFATPPVYSFGS